MSQLFDVVMGLLFIGSPMILLLVGSVIAAEKAEGLWRLLVIAPALFGSVITLCIVYNVFKPGAAEQPQWPLGIFILAWMLLPVVLCCGVIGVGLSRRRAANQLIESSAHPHRRPAIERFYDRPRFGRDGDLYTISYITGPSHVWLGVHFVDEPDAEPKIVQRPPVGSSENGILDPARILESVIAGAVGTGKFPKRIEFVANDSPAYDLYEHCSQLLAQHAASDET